MLNIVFLVLICIEGYLKKPKISIFHSYLISVKNIKQDTKGEVYADGKINFLRSELSRKK